MKMPLSMSSYTNRPGRVIKKSITPPAVSEHIASAGGVLMHYSTMFATADRNNTSVEHRDKK